MKRSQSTQRAWQSLLVRPNATTSERSIDNFGHMSIFFPRIARSSMLSTQSRRTEWSSELLSKRPSLRVNTQATSTGLYSTEATNSKVRDKQYYTRKRQVLRRAHFLPIQQQEASNVDARIGAARSQAVSSFIGNVEERLTSFMLYLVKLVYRL
jgi:hypothetical protein